MIWGRMEEEGNWPTYKQEMKEGIVLLFLVLEPNGMSMAVSVKGGREKTTRSTRARSLFQLFSLILAV